MVFRIRLNNQDWYSEAPTELDPPLPLVSTALGIPEVPIIRVYGTTADGEKVLAHVHGALPYIYIDYPGPYKTHGPDDEFTRE
jgi:DNA polymerase zeta